VHAAGESRRLRIGTPLGAELREGDSVAVNGVCLTVARLHGSGFSAVVSPETLRVTTLGGLTEGALVNLERPLRADGRFGGHFVLGHVDGVGRLVAFRPEADCYWLEVDVPAALDRYLIPKGSIAIDGISLTIARLDGTRVGVQIVPFTFEHTSLRDAAAGTAVNIEADVIGKYVARQTGGRAQADGGTAAPPMIQTGTSS